MSETLAFVSWYWANRRRTCKYKMYDREMYVLIYIRSATLKILDFSNWGFVDYVWEILICVMALI